MKKNRIAVFHRARRRLPWVPEVFFLVRRLSAAEMLRGRPRAARVVGDPICFI